MCKSKKVKRLARLPSIAVSAVGRTASELQQSRFVRVQLETEFVQPLLQRFKARFGFGFVFKTDHEIVRIAHHDTLPSAVAIPPLVDPQVQYIVQKHVGEDR